jgi:hypothetical protein
MSLHLAVLGLKQIGVGIWGSCSGDYESVTSEIMACSLLNVDRYFGGKLERKNKSVINGCHWSVFFDGPFSTLKMKVVFYVETSFDYPSTTLLWPKSMALFRLCCFSAEQENLDGVQMLKWPRAPQWLRCNKFQLTVHSLQKSRPDLPACRFFFEHWTTFHPNIKQQQIRNSQYFDIYVIRYKTGG